MTKDMDFARGYIASGEFNGYRIPQHIQNQIVKSYCDAYRLKFVLSRAEYWINGNSDCQLWAALKEGFKHIVFYSIWQLPEREVARKKVYRYCITNKITLHFATESMHSGSSLETFSEFEILLKVNSLLLIETNYDNYLDKLKKIIQEFD